MRPARIVGGLRHVVPVMLCALVGHLALYRSFAPSGHAYFAWYEPLVAGLSVAAVLLLAGLLVVACLSRDELRQRIVPLLLPAGEPAPASFRATRLALGSVAFLTVQETIERTLGEGRLAPGAFGPSQVALVLVAIAAAASLVVVVERSCARLIALVVPRLPRWRTRLLSVSLPSARPLVERRRSPLSQLRGLRAPPLPA